jgi:hypothetical protein
MSAANRFQVSYAQYKASIASALPVYYQVIAGGYTLYSTSRGNVFVCIIVDPVDVADFNATLLPTATAVGAEGVAIIDSIIAAGALDTYPVGSKITDGVRNAAVKAASTAPVATDPALVVSLSPNSTTRSVAAQAGAQSSVAGSAVNVTLLAANVNRLGATLYNDSNQNFYVKLGATASATSFTVRLSPQSYYEVPFGYTGIIDGIQASANGNMRITELS